jgi:16S rRNA (cytidine1402-2'-O)-methyltransferase
MKGKLYLIPATIGDTAINDVIPDKVQNIVNTIKHFIVENERTARRQLIQMGIKTPIDDLHFYVLNKHTDKLAVLEFLNPCIEHDMGLLSEAGVPAVADPGSEVVSLAHKKNIQVIPLVGPSSILLALMASGLNGQSFSFHGYLAVKNPEKSQQIKHLENLSHTHNQTQIFIETPYRNNQMLEELIKTCSAATQICVACNISTKDEFIRTMTAEKWKKNKVDLHKKPTIFLLLR